MPKKDYTEQLDEIAEPFYAEVRAYLSKMSSRNRDRLMKDLKGSFDYMLGDYRRTFGLKKQALPKKTKKSESAEPEPAKSKEYDALLAGISEMNHAYSKMTDELFSVGRGQRLAHTETAGLLRQIYEGQQRLERALNAYAQRGEGYAAALRESVAAAVGRIVADGNERLLRYLGERDKRLRRELEAKESGKEAEQDAPKPRLVKRPAESS